MIRRRARRLDDENVVPTDVLVDFHEGLAVRKTGDRGLAQGLANGAAHFLGEDTIGVARENFQPRFAHKARRWGRTAPGGRLFCVTQPSTRIPATRTRPAAADSLDACLDRIDTFEQVRQSSLQNDQTTLKL